LALLEVRPERDTPPPIAERVRVHADATVKTTASAARALADAGPFKISFHLSTPRWQSSTSVAQTLLMALERTRHDAARCPGPRAVNPSSATWSSNDGPFGPLQPVGKNDARLEEISPPNRSSETEQRDSNTSHGGEIDAAARRTSSFSS
jgi:hypothetical protein